MFLLFITWPIKVYVPFWNLLSCTRCVTHFSSAGAQVKHCTLTTFQQLHLTTKVWKKTLHLLEPVLFSICSPNATCDFFSQEFTCQSKCPELVCHTFHISACILPTFELKLYLCPLWSWDKLNPCQTQACSNLKKPKKSPFRKL